MNGTVQKQEENFPEIHSPIAWCFVLKNYPIQIVRSWYLTMYDKRRCPRRGAPASDLDLKNSVEEKNMVFNKFLKHIIHGGDSVGPPRTAPALSDDGRITFPGVIALKVGITVESGLKIPDPSQMKEYTILMIVSRKFSENVPVPPCLGEALRQATLLNTRDFPGDLMSKIF